jgi:hypothetical protein
MLSLITHLKLLLKFTFRAYLLYKVDKSYEVSAHFTMLVNFILVCGFYFLDRHVHLDHKPGYNIRTGGDLATIDKQREDVLETKWNSNMLNLVSLVGDIENTKPAKNFRKLAKLSPCLFAKSSKIASHVTWNYDLSLEKNILQSLPLFYTFIKNIQKLDGFAFEVPTNLYGRNLCEFSVTVMRVLTVLSDNDPAKLNCMKAGFIDKAGWCFSFDTETFFVTTFGDIYPKTHSRHCHLKNKMYILIQPEVSFYNKKLPSDHGPSAIISDIRDKIRYNFQKKMCPYYVPSSPSYPMADHIVKPLIDIKSSYTENYDKMETNAVVKKNRIVKFYLHDVEKITLMNNEEYKKYNGL